MGIEPATIREILARTDLGAFVGTHVQLRKRGRDLVGLCPFHAEKTPSFHVHPDRGFFKCFGCGASGDAIKFLQLHENLPFPEAVRELARRAGVVLAAQTPAAARTRGEKEQIYAANALAAAFFARTLQTSPQAEHARAYVTARGLSAATVAAFKLGYAPRGWNALLEDLRANGVDSDLAERAGLLKAGERGPYDFYRDRLMIPTASATGEIVAFGGRSLDGSEPKYLNTGATPVHTKGRELFALGIARRAALAAEALVVVEGYLDCIALHQAGLTNVVASLGTAFTPEQAALIRKYAERVFLCFDSDAAGQAATAKSIDVLRRGGCTPFVVALPAGEDPDSFVRAAGVEAFRERLAAAIEGTQFALDVRIDEIKRKRLSPSRAELEAAEVVGALPASEADRWFVYVAQALGLSVAAVRASRFRSTAANFAPRPRLGVPVAAAAGSRYVALAAEPPPLEREVLAAFVDEPPLVAEYADRIGLDVFREGRYRELYATLLAHRAALATSEDIFAVLAGDRDAVETVVTLQRPDRSSRVRFQDSTARRAHLDRVVESLTEGRLDARRRELEARGDAAFAAGQTLSQPERDELDGLVEELNQRKKKRLGAR